MINLNAMNCNKVLLMRGLVIEGQPYRLIDRLDGQGVQIDFWDIGLPPSQLELDLAASPNIALQKTSIPNGVRLTAVTSGYSGDYQWRCVSPDKSLDYALNDAGDEWEIETGQLGQYTVWCGAATLGVAVITFEGE